MYRVAYTKLGESQIGAALTRVAKAGPVCASQLSGDLAGKSLRIVTDKGPTLDYKFTSDRQLSLSENGGKPVGAGYGALTLDRITLVAHLIPGTLRGYASVIDNRTGIATVFDLWFAGYQDKRELMREIYGGYVATTGKPEPQRRHKASNRAEGKGFYWKQDTGYETLEYYPSAAYTHFVELTGSGEEMGYCAPSDYLQIDDEFYIYTRVECEFSGTLTLSVMDLNRQEQIGLRLGFDRLDALDYYLFRAKGEWVGQIAQFERFGDTRGDVLPPPDNAKKGERRIYRPLGTMTKMSKAEVDKAVADHRRVFAPRIGTGSGASGMATNGVPSIDALAGREFTLRYDDGPTIEYKVADAETLSWRMAGGAWTQARYQAWESMPGVFLFGHLLDGMPNHDGHMIVADFDAGLVTCFNGTLNGPYFANEACARTLFGVIEGKGVPSPGTLRHQRTREMLGRALTWNYAPGLTSMHLYSTPRTVSWIIFTDGGAGGMEWSGPGDFVKIRDGLYFCYWLEDACNGTLGTVLINMRTMHDAGIGYHCGTEGLSMSQIGAHGRHAGKFEVTRFFATKEG